MQNKLLDLEPGKLQTFSLAVYNKKKLWVALKVRRQAIYVRAFLFSDFFSPLRPAETLTSLRPAETLTSCGLHHSHQIRKTVFL
jgi:hypothetical protein